MPRAASLAELQDRTRQDLYEVARKLGIEGRSKMGKWELTRSDPLPSEPPKARKSEPRSLRPANVVEIRVYRGSRCPGVLPINR